MTEPNDNDHVRRGDVLAAVQMAFAGEADDRLMHVLHRAIADLPPSMSGDDLDYVFWSVVMDAFAALGRELDEAAKTQNSISFRTRCDNAERAKVMARRHWQRTIPDKQERA